MTRLVHAQENVCPAAPLAVGEGCLDDDIGAGLHGCGRGGDRGYIDADSIYSHQLSPLGLQVRQVSLLMLDAAVSKHLEHRVPDLGRRQLASGDTAISCG
jgi:hypothetical protein